MKLNVRLLLTTFLIVLVISISSTFVFYALANKVLTEQQYKTLINATTNLAFTLQAELQETDEDFRSLVRSINDFNSINLDSTSIDFLFTLANDTLINTKELKVKSSSYLNIRTSSFRKFFTDNQTLVLRYAQLQSGRTYYYGRMVTSELLNKIGEKINADVGLIVNGSPVEVSNPDRFLSVTNASRALKLKNNFDLYSEELDDADFVAAIYTPRFIFFPEVRVNFIVFQAFREGVEFRNSLRIVMLLIVLAGSIVTFIIFIVSTTKLRKQIELLSIGAEETGKGNLDHRVPVITNDEIGHFGETFNKMLDEIVRTRKAEKEYSEFITLINQNPTLKEIADAALSKIIKSTHLAFGALYVVEGNDLRLVSSHGISKRAAQLTGSDIYEEAIKKKEIVQFHFQDNYPEVKTGITTVKIKYLVIYPVVYNKETVAVLELASESNPDPNIEKYIGSIHEQLAVGLVNAKSFEQLENFVNELRKLNEEYQKQNTQIVEQNDELKRLHLQIKEKAEELEKQRAKAIELTKVKSEFLASMSHELRTPLISILGLTDLMLKDSEVIQKVKERLSIVNRNGKKLLSLINNILEFSKFESGKIEIKKETIILKELINEIKPNVFHLALEKNLKLVFDYPTEKTILLNTDKDKLEQVLLNLIVNAVKFTETGFIRVKINLSGRTGLSFEVEDTGIGISEEHQKDIFNEFKQVDGSTSRKYGGAGLGLAISKKYIELLGGSLSLTSEVGKGSTFAFTLEDVVLDVIEGNEHKFLSIDDEPKFPADSAGKKKPVLLISDSSATKKLIGDYLASYNIQYESVNSCSDARNIVLQNNEYSAIILNPYADSFEFVAEIKRNKLNKLIPLIFVLILEEQKYGWEPNIYDYVLSPLQSEELNALLDKLEAEARKKINRVCLISALQENIKKVGDSLKEYSNPVTMQSITSYEAFVEFSKSNQTDALIVDVESLGEQSFEVCFTASLSKMFRNTPILFLLPENFTAEQQQIMKRKFEELAVRVKLHPLDILKVLRDRLNLEQPESKRKIMLIEDSPTDTELKAVSKKNKISKPTILIVDDDDDALFTVGEYVKALDCDTIFAHNGMECLLMLNHVVPDVILLDIMMPQMDGFETIKRIRSDNRFARLPVIALTAYAMLDNKNVIEKNGFNDLVTKPINSQMLSSKITKYLS